MLDPHDPNYVPKPDLVTRSAFDLERKMQGVGLSGLLIPPIAGWIAVQMPGISEACGNELAGWGVATAIGYATAAVNFAAGYMTKSRA